MRIQDDASGFDIACLALAAAAIAAALFLGGGCAHGSQGEAIGRAELNCAKAVEPDVVVAVVAALAAGGATDPGAWIIAMETLARKDGYATIKCAVAALLAQPPGSPAMGFAAMEPAPPRLNRVTAPRAVEWLGTR